MNIWRLFSSITLDDSSRWLPLEPGEEGVRTIGQKKLTLDPAEGVSAFDDVDVVIIGEQSFKREH